MTPDKDRLVLTHKISFYLCRKVLQYGVFQAPGADFSKKMPIIRHFVPIVYHSYIRTLKKGGAKWFSAV